VAEGSSQLEEEVGLGLGGTVKKRMALDLRVGDMKRKGPVANSPGHEVGTFLSQTRGGEESV